jgi:hypothetical protein
MRALLTVMLGFLATLVAVPATPAHASPSGMLCFPIHDRAGDIVGWHCIEIPVVICPPPCGPWAIDLFEGIVLPRDVEIGYLDQLGGGLELVGAAAFERDPAVAERLLGQAQELFLAAASALGRARVQVGDVGVADLEGKQIRSDPSLDWLKAAGTDVGNGTQDMQAALVEPAPLPWVEAGMKEFGSAYQHLAFSA